MQPLLTYRCETIRFRDSNVPIFSEQRCPSYEAFLTSERRGRERELGRRRGKTGDIERKGCDAAGVKGKLDLGLRGKTPDSRRVAGFGRFLRKNTGREAER